MPVKRWRTRDLPQLIADGQWRLEPVRQQQPNESSRFTVIAKDDSTHRLTVWGAVSEGRTIPFPTDCGIENIVISTACEAHPALTKMAETLQQTLERLGFTVVLSMPSTLTEGVDVQTG